SKIEVRAVGGYSEVGRNMTAIKIGDEVILLDMGLQLDNYIKVEDEREASEIVSTEQLIKANAIPNDSTINDWKDKVKLIICTHAHLDHLGAIPYLAKNYDCPVLGTPYTIEVLKTILQDNKLQLKNQLKQLNKNAKYKLSKDITIEFFSVTHSTPQTVLIAIHSSAGVILYANDFKFDMFPVMEKKSNVENLQQLKNVKLLIVDSLYAEESKKMPGERVAKAMLKDVLLGTANQGKAIIITTFSSHLARLSSIIKYAKELNRNILFVGRSLAKYVEAGHNVNLINWKEDIKILKYGNEIKRKFKKISKEKDKYVVVVTGHQGEPRAVLSRIAKGDLPLEIEEGDHVIFSSNIIPVDINIKNREKLEKLLAQKGARIFKDIHVSGHGAKEDLRDLIEYTKPLHVIPTHGDKNKLNALAKLAKELGYSLGKTVHILKNGQKINID
ncbi:RNase J family beta-CASP ribonuclease, partial [Candidatus Woesearchaeota archaeon]|nr:RNase J family beta-CASP ribonuclease [Candidatus Woesearchaeota archaeon]